MKVTRATTSINPAFLIADRKAAATAAPSGRRKEALDGRKKVGELVGNIFYGTMLKQMHASAQKGTLLRGGRGEEVFGGQLALEMSKRIGESANNPLADRMHRSILKHDAARRHTLTSTQGANKA